MLLPCIIPLGVLGAFCGVSSRFALLACLCPIKRILDLYGLTCFVFFCFVLLIVNLQKPRGLIPFEDASVNISSVQNGKLSIRLPQLVRTCILHPLSTIIANTCQY